jgi:hypothetical protein
LRFCKDWLARYHQEVIEAFSAAPSEEIPTTEYPEADEREGLPMSGQSLLTFVKKTKDWRRGMKGLPVQLVKDNEADGRKCDYLAVIAWQEGRQNGERR